MKDGSIMINTLASYNWWTYRNLFQMSANDMSETVDMINDVLPKSSKFCIVRIIRFCSNFASFW